MFPVCTFYILSKGCSSHDLHFFLWKAVENGKGVQRGGLSETALVRSSINPPASNKRRKRNQSISDRKPREGARRHVAAEGFCVARVASSGSCCPQCAQFAQVASTGLSHFRHGGCSKVPQRGQNGNFAFSICPQPGHGFGRGSRRMKYKIIPIALGTKIASSVHITYRICRRFASP